MADIRIVPASGYQAFIGTDGTKVVRAIVDSNGVLELKRYLATTAEEFFKVSGFTNANILTITDAGTGTVSVNGALVISGDLTVNGTTTTVNSTTISVDDKNIELGSIASPTDVTADGGGITLRGTTDKTFNWIDATDAWTSSEHLNLLSGKAYYINGTSVLNNNTLGSGILNSSLTSVGTIGTGTWQGSIIAGQYGGTGVNNTGKTITLGGNLTTSGAFTTTFTATGNTAVTLPTTGTLATLAGSETLTNKTISGSSNTLSNIANASLTNSSVTIGSTNVALGATVTTFAGLTSVTSTTFVGALTGNATTSTAAWLQVVPSSAGSIDANTVGSSTYVNYGSTGYWVNTPVSMYGVLETVNRISGSNIAYQFAIDIRHGNTNFGDLYFRTWNNSAVWTGWGKIWHSLNDGSGSGLDADLLDGMNAAATNTVSTIVNRDASGNFSAGTITAALTGNASTATTLQNARTIAISGDITGTATSFNGSANISIPITDINIGGSAVTGTLNLARLGTGRIWDHVTYVDNTTNTGWYKLISVTLGTGLYVGVNFEIEIVVPGGNYGGSNDAQYYKYFVRLSRSAGVQDDALAGTVSGPSTSFVRVENVSLGVYEVQISQPSNYTRTSYRVRHFTQNSIGSGGSIAYHSAFSSAATGTGTMATATATHDDWFTNIRINGQLFSTIATGTAPFSVASTTKVTNLNADLLDDMTTASANTVSTIVNRDASGNFSAGLITAQLYNNAALLRVNSTNTTTQSAAEGILRLRYAEIENYVTTENPLNIWNNGYRHSDNTIKYSQASKKAMGISLYNGEFSFKNAAGGTADTTITFTNRFVVNESGQITTGIWQSTVIDPAYGGTGNSSYTIGDILYASGTTTLSKLAGVATGNALISGGASTAPSWGKIGLTTHVSGILPIANGGTNLSTTPTNGQLLIGNGSGYTLATLTGTTNRVTVTNGSGTITLSGPQDLHSGASPTFTGLKLSDRYFRAFTDSSNGLVGIRDIAFNINNTSNGGAVIKITTPFVTTVSTMVGMVIFIYDYNATHIQSDTVELYVQFYGSSSTIYNESVHVLGGRASYVSSVKFGYNASNNVQLIITLGSDLAYPKVIVKDVYTSHTSANSSNYIDSANWLVELTTDETSYTNVQTINNSSFIRDIFYQNASNINAGTLAVAYGGTGVNALSNVLGTTNQVTVSNGTARIIGGDITLSLPQNIHSGANPTFAGANLSAALISTMAWNATTGSGQIYLNGATGNRIDYVGNGVAAPAFTTRSAGTKLVLYPALTGTTVDYSIGIESGGMWFATTEAVAARQFRWYAGTTALATLIGTGQLGIGIAPSTVSDVRVHAGSSGTAAGSRIAVSNSDLTSYLNIWSGHSGSNPTVVWTTGKDLRFGTESSGTFGTSYAERWRITSAGVLEAAAAQTIRTATGNLTLGTAAGNGNILLSANGTGAVIVGTTTALVDSRLETYIASGMDILQVKVRTFDSSVENYLGLGAANILYYRNLSTGVNLKLQTSVLNSSVGGNIVFAPSAPGVDHTPTEVMRIWRSGNVSIGNTTDSVRLSVTGEASITSTAATPTLTLTDTTAGNDPYIRFVPATAANAYAIGIDDSDTDKFKISYGSSAALGTNDRFTIDAAGNVYIKAEKAIFSQQEITSVTAGTHTVSSISVTNYRAIFFDYVIYSGTSQVMGTVFCSWNGSALEWTDVGTLVQGSSTGDVVMSAIHSAGNIILQVVISGGNAWSVKALARGI